MEQNTEKILSQVKKAVSGKDEVVRKVLTAIFAGGHVLIEDVPGVGKTTLALAFSKAFGLDFRRVQFTPDTVASDITGYTAFDRESGKFIYHEGAAMTNILLADEINRTSGKTQSALLEVMEEGGCTVDGVTYEVPKPFVVLATQNPAGSAGTSPLPMSQLDRFMIKLEMGYPDRESMINILRERHHENPLDSVKEVCTAAELAKIKEKCENIFVSDAVYDYIARLAEATCSNENISVGVSPRGALALCRMSKAQAFAEGREYVVPKDIRANFADVCAHRIVLSKKAKIAEMSARSAVEAVMDTVECPENEGAK